MFAGTSSPVPVGNVKLSCSLAAKTMGVSPVPKAMFEKGVHENGVVWGGSLVWYMMR